MSIGQEHRALIELKLGNHKRYKDGIDYQLPAYLKVEGIDLGIFVLICYSRNDYDSSKILFENAKELSKEYDKDIRFVRIDSSGTLESASKIKNKSGMGFEE